MADTILIVDDEPAVTMGLRRSLRNEPYEIESRNSAKDALRLLGKKRVDVVISDEQMPGMSGSEFLSIVCRDYPDTIRIILTGHTNMDAIVKSINEGEIYRFLMKPCGRDELRITIRQALEQRQLRLLGRKALHTLQHQASMLKALEAQCPGVTSVERDETGVIILDDMHDNLDVLTQELTEILGDFGPASAAG
jgi:two-component system, probable response regulator PhcQ